MKKINWIPGAPTTDGIYWFDSGLLLTTEPMVVQVLDGHAFLLGRSGGGPLENYYDPKICKKARYVGIDLPDNWVGIKEAIDEPKMWVKTTKGFIGFGIFTRWAGKLYGDIVWLNDPDCKSSNGTRISEEDNYQFCKVKVPKLK